MCTGDQFKEEKRKNNLVSNLPQMPPKLLPITEMKDFQNSLIQSTKNADTRGGEFFPMHVKASLNQT